MNSIETKNFPSTRFQGSKRRLLPWLYEHFSTLEFETCLDVFGGSSSVSYLLKRMGKEVTFNDYLKSSATTARAVIKNNNTKLTSKELENLFSECVHSDFVSKTYQNIFFTDQENKQIDSIIHRIYFEPNHLTGFKQDIALHCLFQALLMKRPFNLFHRANLNLRTRDVKRKFGNKTTWDTPLYDLMERIRKETNTAIFNNGKKHKVMNNDALDLSNGFDVVYLDPPYYPKEMNGPAPDYYHFYHFLEGIADYLIWESRIDHGYAHRPILNKERSFTRSRFLDDLDTFFSKHKESIIVMSYKSPGFPDIGEISSTLQKTHKEPTIASVEHSYALNKKNGHYSENLIVAKPISC